MRNNKPPAMRVDNQRLYKDTPFQNIIELFKLLLFRRESIKEIIQRLCSYKGVDIIEGLMMSDHVHLLLSIPPKFSVAQFMGYLKGKSALMILAKYANLKYKFGNRHFWAEGYYVSTVGFNEATVRKYIREQESRNIVLDKLSAKEFEDPFEGGK